MTFNDPTVVPAEMDLDRTRGLTVVWSDGRRSFFSVAYLRKHCPCATCREVRRESESNPLRVIDPSKTVPVNVTVLDAHEVGNYALGFHFSDGHATGIYDFRYLRQIDPEA